MSLPQDILKLDFAALRTFRLVYQKASFAAAADELGMNASSISYTIDRVRKAAGDPLFVRQGGGIVPTDQCQSLLMHVERILTEAELISGDDNFDPAKAEAEITILSATYANQVIWPQVIQRLRQEAPGVKLFFLSGYQNLPETLSQGKVDIALTVGTVDVSGIRVLKSNLRDMHVCMMNPAHPLASKKVLTVEDYVSVGHIRFEPFPGWLQAPIRYAVEQGFNPERVIASDVAQDLPHFVQGSDLLAALPSRLAWPWRDRLALRPFDFPTPIRNSMFWSEATHRSPVKAWLRGLILEEVEKLPELRF
ncbi:LysR family transcriptional regulator [Thalassovita sp.]|jgi:DNA-binding transcriptional LysR family regulator|uniref:LysR family transcriptional regulator n=1 Tax=Thalassovita sp. TaxID=1979401 RepID=UPI003B5C6F8C